MPTLLQQAHMYSTSEARSLLYRVMFKVNSFLITVHHGCACSLRIETNMNTISTALHLSPAPLGLVS